MNPTPKKVLAINSSNRKKNTYRILTELKQTLSPQNIEIEIINLFDYNINHCLGCEACIRGTTCPIDDDVNNLMDKLKTYDGIILSTPVYMSNVSSKLKTFIDRTCKWFHRPELVGKPTLLVSTTAGSDLKNTLNYLKKVSIHWGCFPTNQIGKRVNQLNDKLEPKDYSSFVEHLRSDKTKYKPSLGQIINFQVQKVLAMKILEIDTDYWVEQGWDKKVFYYNCSINPIKRFAGKRFYKMLYSKIKKVGE